MWRKILLLVVFGGLSHGAASGWSQTLPTTNLLAEKSCVRWELVRGRLKVLNVGLGHSRTITTSESRQDGSRETLTLQVQAGEVSLRYEWSAGGEHVLVEVTEGDEVTLRRHVPGAADICFRQLAGAPLVVEVVQNKQVAQFRAESLWHLMLSQPQLCRRHLYPLLECLRPAWQLEQQCRGVEESLFQLAREGYRSPRDEVLVLVEQLGSDDFQARQAADRRLRELGQAALPVLNHLARTSLDAEQHFRIRRIQESLEGHQSDTPHRVAGWLFDNNAVWLVLMEHSDSERRRLAAVHLRRLCDQPIEFDPLAAEDQREAQIARLRSDLAVGISR